MERNQVIVVVVVLVAFIAAIAATLYFSQGDGIASQRFRAAPGAHREQAQPLLSNRTDRDDERWGTLTIDSRRLDGGAQSDLEPDPGDDPFLTDDTDEATRSAPALPGFSGDDPGSKLAREALFALTPEEGLRRLAEGAAALDSAAATTSIYTAAAKLHMQRRPPDLTAAEDALAKAAEAAQSTDDEAQYYLAQANFLIGQGESASAKILLANAAAARDMNTVTGIETLLLLGSLHMDEGDNASGTAAYKRAWDNLTALADAGPPPQEGVLRQAALRLTQAYRASGDAQAADAVLGELRARLGE